MGNTAEIMEPFRTKAWPAQAQQAIRTLRRNAPRRPLQTYPIGVPLEVRGSYTPRQLDLVGRTFHFKGKGREAWVRVRLQRIVMVKLLRAMIDEPGIQIGFGSGHGAGATASYRTRAQQAALYAAYQHGGPLAAPPGVSHHERAISVDGYYWTVDEREAMEDHGFHDLLPQDPPHYTYGTRG